MLCRKEIEKEIEEMLTTLNGYKKLLLNRYIDTVSNIAQIHSRLIEADETNPPYVVIPVRCLGKTQIAIKLGLSGLGWAFGILKDKNRYFFNILKIEKVKNIVENIDTHLTIDSFQPLLTPNIDRLSSVDISLLLLTISLKEPLIQLITKHYEQKEWENDNRYQKRKIRKNQ